MACDTLATKVYVDEAIASALANLATKSELNSAKADLEAKDAVLGEEIALVDSKFAQYLLISAFELWLAGWVLEFNALKGAFEGFKYLIEQELSAFKAFVQYQLDALNALVNWLQNAFNGFDIGNLETRVGVLEGLFSSHDRAINALSNQVSTNTSNINNLQDAIDFLRSYIDSQIQGVYQALFNSLAEINGKISSLSNRVTSNENAISNIESLLDGLSGRVSSLESAFQGLQAQLEELGFYLGNLLEEIFTYVVGAINQLRLEIQLDIDSLWGAIGGLDGRVTALENIVNNLGNPDLSKVYDYINQRISELSGLIDVIFNRLSGIDNNIGIIQGNITNINNTTNNITNDLNLTNTNLTNLTDQVNTLEALQVDTGELINAINTNTDDRLNTTDNKIDNFRDIFDNFANNLFGKPECAQFEDIVGLVLEQHGETRGLIRDQLELKQTWKDEYMEYYPEWYPSQTWKLITYEHNIGSLKDAILQIFKETKYLKSRLGNIYRAIGVPDFPGSLPHLLDLPFTDEFGNVNPQNKILRFTDFCTYLIEQIDGVIGQFPFEIEIEDVDLTEEGNQTKTVKVANVAEGLAELFGFAFSGLTMNDANLNILLRLVPEIVRIRQLGLTNQDILVANKEFLGYAEKEVRKEVKSNFSLQNDFSKIDELLKEEISKYKSIEFDAKGKGNDTVLEYLIKLLYVAEIFKKTNTVSVKDFEKWANSQEIKSLFPELNDENIKSWNDFVKAINDPDSLFNLGEKPSRIRDVGA